MKSKVCFTKEITSESLVKIYESLNHELKGKVAVKISTGEPGGHNFLNPNLIKALVNKLNGTIVECCTAYPGKRMNPSDHWQVIKDHGFYDIAPCDIMDEDGEIKIPIDGGKHLNGINYVGSHIKNYDSMLMLSHFKGHIMAGFGGALKNMSIGVASKIGKAWIHSARKAEADKSVVDYFNPENIVYINIANNISIDCDCDNNPKDPEIADIGIFASLDPVALDKCCYDTIMNLTENGANSLMMRMLDKNAIHIVEEAERLGLGTTLYELVSID